MASTAASPTRPVPLAPDLFERILALAAALVLLMLLAALWSGRPEWATVPALVWAHIATVATALAVTPTILLRRRGDRLHRRLGYVWAASLFATGLLTFGIRDLTGGLSFIHLFSVMTVVGVPGLIITARRHEHEAHRGIVRGLSLGGLVIAGLTAFPPERLLGGWLFG